MESYSSKRINDLLREKRISKDRLWLILKDLDSDKLKSICNIDEARLNSILVKLEPPTFIETFIIMDAINSNLVKFMAKKPSIIRTI